MIATETSFVRSTVRYGIFVGRCNSSIGRNVVLLCSRFKWQFNDFVCGNVSLNKNLCGRDGRTICGPERVPKSTCVSL